MHTQLYPTLAVEEQLKSRCLIEDRQAFDFKICHALIKRSYEDERKKVISLITNSRICVN